MKDMENLGLQIIGTEQWYLLFLGILFHFLSKLNKAQKTRGAIKFQFVFWVKENWFDFVGSTLLSIAGIYIAKDYLHFGEAPLAIRNAFIFTIGYNSNSVIKNWLVSVPYIKKSINK
jgi:hypothetical protein